MLPKSESAKLPDLQPIRNLTPKGRFLQSPQYCKAHHNWVDSEIFNISMDYALLEYQRLISSKVTDQVTACAAGLKMQGVVEFIAVLRNLADQAAAVPRRQDPDNLQH